MPAIFNAKSQFLPEALKKHCEVMLCPRLGDLASSDPEYFPNQCNILATSVLYHLEFVLLIQ